MDTQRLKVVVDPRLPPGVLIMSFGPYTEPATIRLREAHVEQFFTNLEQPLEHGRLPITRSASGQRRGGNGRLQSMSKEDLIAEIQKLQRRARVHKQTITQLNRAHAEDLRLLGDYQRENDRLAAALDDAQDKLVAIDTALRDR